MLFFSERQRFKRAIGMKNLFVKSKFIISTRTPFPTSIHRPPFHHRTSTYHRFQEHLTLFTLFTLLTSLSWPIHDPFMTLSCLFPVSFLSLSCPFPVPFLSLSCPSHPLSCPSPVPLWVQWSESHASAGCVDLGRVGTVLTDKTGTLTENVMRMRECSVDSAGWTVDSTPHWLLYEWLCFDESR